MHRPLSPVDPQVAYKAPSTNCGGPNDPMVSGKINGVNVFGGGLALYDAGRRIVGGLGVSGDASCADYNIAWRARHALGLDHLAGVPRPAGLFAVDSTHPDNIIFDITPNPNGGTGIGASGFGHPTCLNTGGSSTLPAVQQPAGTGRPGQRAGSVLHRSAWLRARPAPVLTTAILAGSRGLRASVLDFVPASLPTPFRERTHIPCDSLWNRTRHTGIMPRSFSEQGCNRIWRRMRHLWIWA